MSMKKAFKNGMITLDEYKVYLRKEFNNIKNQLNDMNKLYDEISEEYSKVLTLETYYCITYTKYYDGRIESPHVSGLENTDKKPINTCQEREDYAVYHEWYEDSNYVYDYINKLRGDNWWKNYITLNSVMLFAE